MSAGRTLAVALAVTLVAAGAQARAPTIVSINLCADQLALVLADRAQILSVGRLAGDPALSALHALAAGLPTNGGAAEEVVRLAPDIVLSGAYRERRTNDLLRRMGLRVLALTAPNDVDGTAALAIQVGEAIGQPGRGKALAAEVRAIFAAPAEAPSRAALVWRPNGFVSGRGTLIDAALAAAGLENAAARMSAAAWGTLPLERLVARPPDVLVLDDHLDAKTSRAQMLLIHPALARLAPPMRIGAVATRDWLCAGPWIAAAIRRLRAIAGGP
ncbi:MAG: ABC transporter substrate-binding protein [Alphaproteobacteria bacterium]